jgi:hypothetical protein
MRSRKHTQWSVVLSRIVEVQAKGDYRNSAVAGACAYVIPPLSTTDPTQARRGVLATATRCPDARARASFAEDLSNSVAWNGTMDDPRNPHAIANRRGAFATSETAGCFIT